jgi:hypothetical protein
MNALTRQGAESTFIKHPIQGGWHLLFFVFVREPSGCQFTQQVIDQRQQFRSEIVGAKRDRVRDFRNLGHVANGVPCESSLHIADETGCLDEYHIRSTQQLM